MHYNLSPFEREVEVLSLGFFIFQKFVHFAGSFVYNSQIIISHHFVTTVWTYEYTNMKRKKKPKIWEVMKLIKLKKREREPKPSNWTNNSKMLKNHTYMGSYAFTFHLNTVVGCYYLSTAYNM